MAHIHADRREPAAPDGPITLDAVADELVAEAGAMASGRAARTLTPGMHAPLKQTLVALRAGVRLDEHEANGPATIHLLRGAASIGTADDRIDLRGGDWAIIPAARHDLQAAEDTVALITVAPTA